MGGAASCQAMASADGIHDSAFDGDIASIKRWLRLGQNVNQANEQGDTALHMAVLNAQVEATRYLLEEANAHPNSSGGGGKSPLHLAAGSGSLECVSLLLAHQAQANATDAEGNTPLMVACGAGSPELVQTLLRASADPNQRNHRAISPILVAAENSLVEVVSLLLEAGANPSAPPPNGMATPVIVVSNERIREMFREHDRRKEEAMAMSGAMVVAGGQPQAVSSVAVGVPVMGLPAPGQAPMMALPAPGRAPMLALPAPS